MSFQTNIQLVSNQLCIKFQGVLDEDASLPETLPETSTKEIHLDLSQLKALTSIGIRELMNWVKKIDSSGFRFRFANCPKSFVDQLNMVPDMFPSTAKVDSFFVPYYSEETKEEKIILYQRNLHFHKGSDEKIKIFHPDKDNSGKNLAEQKFEIDVIQEKYFKFLSKWG
jgi:anti-anti-sigma regulatory factor